MKENLEIVEDIEARVNEEAWTVTTKLDTIMLKNWLSDVSVYLMVLNNKETT